MPQPRRERLHPDATGIDGLRGDPFAILMAAEGATADEMLAATVASLNRYRPAFHLEANCQGSTVDFTSKAATERSKAFSLCGACDVRRECLDWALDIDDQHSILGGTDPAARRAMTRHQKGTTDATT